MPKHALRLCMDLVFYVQSRYDRKVHFCYYLVSVMRCIALVCPLFFSGVSRLLRGPDNWPLGFLHSYPSLPHSGPETETFFGFGTAGFLDDLALNFPLLSHDITLEALHDFLLFLSFTWSYPLLVILFQVPVAVNPLLVHAVSFLHELRSELMLESIYFICTEMEENVDLPDRSPHKDHMRSNMVSSEPHQRMNTSSSLSPATLCHGKIKRSTCRKWCRITFHIWMDGWRLIKRIWWQLEERHKEKNLRSCGWREMRTYPTH